MSVTEERTRHIFSKRDTLCSPTIVVNRMNQITHIPSWIPFSHPFLTHSDIFTNILAFWSTYPICEFFYLKERCGCSLEEQGKGTNSNSVPESKKLDLYNDDYCFWIIVKIFFLFFIIITFCDKTQMGSTVLNFQTFNFFSERLLIFLL